jgi:hypothetical protein
LPRPYAATRRVRAAPRSSAASGPAWRKTNFLFSSRQLIIASTKTFLFISTFCNYKYFILGNRTIEACSEVFALGGLEWCAGAHCRQTLAEGELGLSGNEAKSRVRKEADPAKRGNAQSF